MHDLFWRQRTGALGLVRGYGTNCMRERGPARVRIGCARRPGSRASIDRPVAGRRWQSVRTPNPRGQAHREKGPVRAEGAGAHLWDHLDNLQRLRRPPSRQPEGVGCRPESTGFTPDVPCLLQEDVVESALLGGPIKAGMLYGPAQVAASRRTLKPRTRNVRASAAPFQP